MAPNSSSASVKSAGSSSTELDRSSARLYPQPSKEVLPATHSLDDEELRRLEELRASLPEDMTDLERAYFDDRSLVRYLRARKFNVEKAREMLVNTLNWRRETKPHLIMVEEVEEEAVTGKAYINGYDREGRPVIVLTPGRENTTTYDRQLRFVIYLFEKVVNVMPEGVEQLVVVIDFQSFSLMKAPPLSVSKSFVDVLSAHYPERLHHGVCVNPPWIFWGFYRLIAAFLDPITASKVKFVDTSKQEDLEMLHDLFDPENLESRLGGSHEFDFVFERYWADLNGVQHRIAF